MFEGSGFLDPVDMIPRKRSVSAEWDSWGVRDRSSLGQFAHG